MKLKLKKRWLNTLIGIIFLLGFAVAGRKYFSIKTWNILKEANINWMAGACVVYVFTRYCNGIALCYTLKKLRKRLSLPDAFRIYFTTSYTNLLIPHLGMGVSAVYLKKKYDLLYTDFAAMAIPKLFIQIFSASICGLATCFWLACRESSIEHAGVLSWIFVVLVLGSGIVLLGGGAPLFKHIKGRLGERLRLFNATWKILSQDLAWVVNTVLIYTGIALLNGLRLQFAFCALGGGWNFPELLVASIIAQFMVVLSLTPGALGFRELPIIVVAQHISGDFMAAAGALIDRVVVTVAILIFGSYSLFKMTRFCNAPDDIESHVE